MLGREPALPAGCWVAVPPCHRGEEEEEGVMAASRRDPSTLGCLRLSPELHKMCQPMSIESGQGLLFGGLAAGAATQPSSEGAASHLWFLRQREARLYFSLAKVSPVHARDSRGALPAGTRRAAPCACTMGTRAPPLLLAFLLLGRQLSPQWRGGYSRPCAGGSGGG